MQENLYPGKNRHSAFILLFFIGACHLAGYATPQLKVDPLHVFLKRLETQPHITFVYDASEINRSISIESDVENVSLEAALNLLTAKGISYKIVGDKIVL